MEPILVPGPPKSAYNKDRRMSDLIRAQVAHFKHLEEKLSPEARATLPQHHIVTENDAARYIALFTRYLGARTRGSAIAAPPVMRPVAMPEREEQPPDLVASAAETTQPQAKAAYQSPQTRSASAPKRKSPSSGKRKK